MVFIWGGQEAFPKNKMKKKKSRYHFFFQKKKNVQDRLNAIVRFELYANKKTGLCREKNMPSMNIKWSIPYLVSKVRPIKCLNISGL